MDTKVYVKMDSVATKSILTYTFVSIYKEKCMSKWIS